LYESVPPKTYGGTERVVSYLTEELVRLGHEVTLFASADSQTRAQLVPMCPRALRLSPECRDSIAYHVTMMERVIQQAREFELIHYHIDYLHFPLSRRCSTPSVTTLHGRLDLPELQPLYDEFRDRPVVSISDAQRAPLPQARFVATVYHGLPPDLYRVQPAPGRYLAFLGRISPEKRVDRAIEIAKRLGMPLKIAAKIDRDDVEYYRNEITPLLQHPLIEFVGEIDEASKQEFLGGASALLFPIDWPEPFGLVMIEAMACGTPVVAMRRGSVPEVIEEGVAGYLADDLADAVRATARALTLDRRACRAAFERRFGVTRMAEDYLRVYSQLIRTQRIGSQLTRSSHASI
jgi:glycosyltransferase involved in cell wall biosynthesis